MKKFFKGIKDQLILDFKTTPLLFLLESVGTLTSLVAATTLAFLGNQASFVFVFASYLTGSFCWSTAMALRKNGFGFLLNLGFGTLNVIGLVKALSLF